MRWLKHIVSIGLLVAAVAVALVTALSDHSDDYGQVPLPGGGVVQLPEGRVVVYLSQLGDGNDPIRQVNTPYTFEVLPLDGGPPVPVASANGAPSATATQRSETIGELGAVAKLDVPVAGAYRVEGSGDLQVGTSSLKFGTNAGAAIADRWKLLAGLIGAAILIALIPVPRGKRRWEDETDAPTGWSSDPRAPYAG
jgi:hypothetical protein